MIDLRAIWLSFSNRGLRNVKPVGPHRSIGFFSSLLFLPIWPLVRPEPAENNFDAQLSEFMHRAICKTDLRAMTSPLENCKPNDSLIGCLKCIALFEPRCH